MSHQDQEVRKQRNHSRANRPSGRPWQVSRPRRNQPVVFNYYYLHRALCWLLRTAVFSSIKLRHDCTWSAPLLASAGMLWAWSDEAALGERFQSTRNVIQSLYPRQQQPARSYQAFTKLLARWTSRLVTRLQSAFRQRMRTALASRWLLHGYAVFGVDGSCVELPRTRSNEAAYAPAVSRKKRKYSQSGKRLHPSYAKKARSPQLRLTTLWHATTGLPWDWRLGPSDSSERGHMLEMLSNLPQHAMIAADAGFVGYDFLSQMNAGGKSFLVRVGSNVRLLRKLGVAREFNGLVYLWPDKAACKQQPSLVLRLVVAQGGKHPVYLVTNVLSSRRLTDRSVCELYRLRWGVELFYRCLKQTFQRRKLRSAKAENARLELEWSLVGLWAMALYAQVELARKNIPASRVSMARVLRAFRRMLRDYRHPAEPRRSLCQILRQAIVDGYTRVHKASRVHIRKKYERPPGPPTIRNATKKQIQLAKQLKASHKKG